MNPRFRATFGLVSLCSLVAFLALLATIVPRASAQANAGVDPALFRALHWRSIGPYRGGRTTSAAGVPGDDRTFYTGAVGGGVWKTENAGRTWAPIMDSQPVSSIGAIAVAPSDPNTVYVGSGEADMRSDIIHGNGMYKSTDAGTTWTHIGLDDSRQIGRILVDPHDPQTLLVAALGHAYGPNDMRGVYRSTDGGASWTRVLFHDRDTGAIDLAATPDGTTVYASLWQTRRPPWNTYPPSKGPGSGLYVSHDRGVTWAPLAGAGFPSAGLGKIGLAVAPSDPSRIYAIVDARAGGLYRSDDAGATWKRANDDPRLWERGWYFCHVAVDPKDENLVYVSDTGVYRSTDGGATVEAIKGSPDGDDFHQLWIDPSDGAHMVLASDQGTSVSLDRAKSWSSWFNQPTGQFYHVATDGAFPYRVYGAQQDSGAAEIVSRSDHRGIEARDWRAISAGGESGYIAPDPSDPDVIFGDKVTRENLRTSQTRAVSPTAGRPGVWRDEWTLPLVFGPNHTLYFANQQIFRTRDGGERWQTISGDLTRPHAGTPATLDAATAADAATGEPRGVVYALAPSPLDENVVWAGTDDGLVRLTRDGAHVWENVTPAAISPWSHIAGIEASHFDARTAYVAVDRHRLDDDTPFLYVTRDAGRTWRNSAAGIPNGSFVNAVREDPIRRGLLYAATETGVFVSFDDAAHWQSLRLDMPLVSVRDIAVRDGDLAVATHGRAFWILDDVEPLRQLAADPSPRARLFAPRVAVRTRDGNDEAEATPPETPLGENPPNGAMLDYVVPAGTQGTVALDVIDASGASIRRFASDDHPKAIDPKDVPFPAYWLVPARVPSAEPGMHRFVWDYHERGADGPLAPPGRYVVRLSLGGRTYSQRLVLVRDPRIAASDADLNAQAVLARAVADLSDRVGSALHEAAALRAALPSAKARIDAVAGAPRSADPDDSTGSAASPDTTSLRYESRLLAELEGSIESADARPTANEYAAWTELAATTERKLATWKTLRGTLSGGRT
jgi:photosystem II stability/assembly factor-like uncharacterized protein